MKTLNEINQEIVQLEKDGEDRTISDKIKNRIRKRLQFLRPLKAYLQENPNQDDLIIHLERLENKRDLINDPANFDKWLWSNPGKTNDLKKSKAEYQKELELPHINSQIKTLKYLLE